jgi:16S rRNA (guanine527-N7)-methyltransferase
MAHKNRSNWSPYKARNEKPGSPSFKDSGKGPASSSGAGSSTVAGKTSGTGSGGTKRPSGKRPSGGGGARGQHRRPQESFSFNEADDRIRDVFTNHGFEDYPHEKRQMLTKFYQLLMSNQHEQNFTRLLNLRDVAIKHFIDSLIVAKLAKIQFPLLDMGTGPGFPGIPLKIHFPRGTIILAEGVQKRVEFLKRVREELELQDLLIIGRNVNLEFFYPVRGVITRAVEDARNTLGNVVNCVQTGGKVYLMKGPNCGPEVQMALDAWGEYFELDDDIAYELPKTPHERRLLIFKKIKPHPLPDFDELDLAWEREHGKVDE